MFNVGAMGTYAPVTVNFGAGQAIIINQTPTFSNANFNSNFIADFCLPRSQTVIKYEYLGCGYTCAINQTNCPRCKRYYSSHYNNGFFDTSKEFSHIPQTQPVDHSKCKIYYYEFQPELCRRALDLQYKKLKQRLVGELHLDHIFGSDCLIVNHIIYHLL